MPDPKSRNIIGEGIRIIVQNGSYRDILDPPGRMDSITEPGIWHMSYLHLKICEAPDGLYRPGNDPLC